MDCRWFVDFGDSMALLEWWSAPTMPTTRVNDINIYYEVHGEGEPLVLIGGLANDVSDYTDHTKIIPELSRRFRVIAFDNRGVGRTDKPDIPYSIPMMAEDAAGLLGALGIGRVHVLGISMGGRIALELTLRRPDMVNKLVLVSTGPMVVKSWRRHIVFGVLKRLPFYEGKYPQPYYAFVRQLEASSSYDCTARLSEIHAPTLIVHGRKDSWAPYKLAEEMHMGIRASKMVTFDGGHLLVFTRSRQFVDTVQEFLSGYA